MKDPVVAAVVPAAGRGERLGVGSAKALHPLGGEPMLAHSVRTLAAGPVDLVVVAVPPGRADQVRAVLAAAHDGAELVVVDGGGTRSDSVRLALAVLPASIEIVLVHDAARALVPPVLVESVAATIRAGHDAAIPVLPVIDTIKEVGPGEIVHGTVDRSVLRSVQTPQGFRHDVLAAAHAAATDPLTDDAGLVEKAGVPVTCVPGSEFALKITRPLDLILAEALVRLP